MSNSASAASIKNGQNEYSTDAPGTLDAEP